VSFSFANNAVSVVASMQWLAAAAFKLSMFLSCYDLGALSAVSRAAKKVLRSVRMHIPTLACPPG
jgi:hypothetical protein